MLNIFSSYSPNNSHLGLSHSCLLRSAHVVVRTHSAEKPPLQTHVLFTNCPAHATRSHLPDTGHSAVPSPDAYSSSTQSPSHKDSRQEWFPKDCKHRLNGDKACHSWASESARKMGATYLGRLPKLLMKCTHTDNQTGLWRLSRRSLPCKHRSVPLLRRVYTDTDRQ